MPGVRRVSWGSFSSSNPVGHFCAGPPYFSRIPRRTASSRVTVTLDTGSSIAAKGASDPRGEEMEPMEVTYRGVAVLALLALAATADAQRRDEGVRQAERLVRASEDTIQAIADTRERLVRTMEIYNSLMADNAENRRRLFNNLQREMERTDERLSRVGERVASMDAEADTLFAEWANSAAAIESENLRQRSQERLETTRARYNAIHTAGQEANERYATFMKTLQDHVTFLGHDLNPSAVASLKPDAEKLNKKADALLEHIDITIATANNNIRELQPQ